MPISDSEPPAPAGAPILVVEDDADVASNLAEYLGVRGFVLDFAYDGAQGLTMAEAGSYAAVILDLGLPGLDGLAVARGLRQRARDVPILMLTARDEVQQKIEGFQAGADDYLVKPFALPELHHRLLALMRRARGPSDARIRVGDLVLDPATREVTRAGTPIRLNRIEFQLLERLARRAPRLVPRRRLEREIWGDEDVSPDLLRSYVYRIRRRIDRGFDAPMLCTVHGEGYRLVVPENDR